MSTETYMQTPETLNFNTYRHPPKGDEGVCLWCGETVTDGTEVSGWTGEGPDWMDDGDFGCAGSPLNTEEGTGGHQVLADVAFDVWELNERREADVRAMTFVDAGDGFVDVLDKGGNPEEYGLTLDRAVARYGRHPVRTMEWVAEHG
jgi:hypothetical protein